MQSLSHKRKVDECFSELIILPLVCMYGSWMSECATFVRLND
jgi:hypothetical protein